MMIRFIISALLLLSVCSASMAQEFLVPLHANINLIYPDLKKTGPALPQNPALKTQAGSLSIPFLEDFFYAPSRSTPDPTLWSDSSVFVNAGYPIRPRSIGVATFDGLNKHGYPYDPGITNNTISKSADRLTSQPINLLVSGSQTLQPSDSVALSFYYQSTGYGDNPEIGDSLVLDFFSPADSAWINNIWFKRRVANSNAIKGDTTFTRAFVWIDSARFLKDNFRFRFRNSATTTGNFDHWHVDYIYLNKNRSILLDTVINDLAFMYVPTPLLRDYSAMPYEQYTTAEIAPNMLVKLKNNYASTSLNMTYGYRIDTGATQLSSYNGNAVVLSPMSQATYAPHAKPPVNFTFAPMTDSTDFKITHFLYQTNSTFDFVPRNDTVVQYQRFRNYYAFDDGSAEAGYYVNAASAKIALKINVNVLDSFLGVRIYFDPVGQILQSQQSAGFRICVWGSIGNLPAVTPIFRDTIFKPAYFNVDPAYSFAEYKLIRPKLMGPGTYFIGIQQLADVMTIGFDRNYDHRNSLYFDSGNGWTQSTLPGSLMIRPIFGKTLPHPVGINDLSQDQAERLLVYPNPASDQLHVVYHGTRPLDYTFLNAMGQVTSEGSISADNGLISTAELPNGIYFLTLKDNKQLVQQQKIIIQH